MKIQDTISVFMAIDALAEKYDIRVNECKHKALIGKGTINGNKVVW